MAKDALVLTIESYLPKVPNKVPKYLNVWGGVVGL